VKEDYVSLNWDNLRVLFLFKINIIRIFTMIDTLNFADDVYSYTLVALVKSMLYIIDAININIFIFIPPSFIPIF